MKFSFGMRVHCVDGSFGALADIVVDPATMRLTHLITDPPADAQRRLIPIELVDISARGPHVRLRCTLAATEELASVREYHELRASAEPGDSDWDLGVEHVLALPYSGIGLAEYDVIESSVDVTYDRVPKGTAELRRASSIVAADDSYLGGVHGLLTDAEGHITDLELVETHLWRRTEITIPVEAVQALETDRVVLRLSAGELIGLPTVRKRRWF